MNVPKAMTSVNNIHIPSNTNSGESTLAHETATQECILKVNSKLKADTKNMLRLARGELDLVMKNFVKV
jgi:hypothetical protein